MLFGGKYIKGEMAFSSDYRGFATIFWVSLDDVSKIKELYGEPTDISKRLYMTDIRGWELNLQEFIAINGERIKEQTKEQN